jgi:hypothetical protein
MALPVNSQFGFKKETTWGTAVTVDKFLRTLEPREGAQAHGGGRHEHDAALQEPGGDP